MKADISTGGQTNRLGRGGAHDPMGHLDQKKLSWIIRQKRLGEMTTSDIARIAELSVQYVKSLWAQYRLVEKPVLHKRTAGRHADSLPGRREESAVIEAFYKYRVGTRHLAPYISRDSEINISYRKLRYVMASLGLSQEEIRKKNRRKWVRYEREFTNSMWHTDWYQIKDKRWEGKWLIMYEDDSSRFITGHGVFDAATSHNAVTVLERAIRQYGKPASIISDHGTQFYAVAAQERKRGATEFEKYLVANDIRHLLARVRHPETNGKIERLFGEFNRKVHLAFGIDDFVHWWNEVKAHESLDWKNFETPALAFQRRMPPDGIAVNEERK